MTKIEVTVYFRGDNWWWEAHLASGEVETSEIMDREACLAAAHRKAEALGLAHDDIWIGPARGPHPGASSPGEGAR